MVLRFLSLLLVLTGCSFIDDFDFEVGDAGALPDVGDDIGGSDGVGGEDVADAGGVDSGGVDGGGDAGTDCTDGCSDLYASFDGTGDWTFHRQDPDSLALSTQEMGTQYGSPSWLGPADGLPAMTACDDAGAGLCLEASDQLLVESGAQGESEAVVVFTAPSAGRYTFNATLTPISGEGSVVFSRNHPWDFLSDESGDAMRTAAPAFGLLAGDRIRIALASADNSVIAEAFEIRARRSGDLANCQAAIRFDDGLSVDCGTFTLAENDPDEATGVTAGEIGGARLFGSGQSLVLEGARFDYSGDFTVQMWARIDDVTHFETELYSDFSGNEVSGPGGIEFGVEPENAAGESIDIVRLQYIFATPDTPPAGADCDELSCSLEIEYPIASLGEFHFYRAVRDTAANEIRLCVDGVLVGSSPLPGDIDISTRRNPRLGDSDFGGNPMPELRGAIDDFRVFTGMLPCE